MRMGLLPKLPNIILNPKWTETAHTKYICCVNISMIVFISMFDLHLRGEVLRFDMCVHVCVTIFICIHFSCEIIAKC